MNLRSQVTMPLMRCPVRWWCTAAGAGTATSTACYLEKQRNFGWFFWWIFGVFFWWIWGFVENFGCKCLDFWKTTASFLLEMPFWFGCDMEQLDGKTWMFSASVWVAWLFHGFHGWHFLARTWPDRRYQLAFSEKVHTETLGDNMEV